MCDSVMSDDDSYCVVCGWNLVDMEGLPRDVCPNDSIETLPESEPIDSQLPDEPISPTGDGE
jgi:hypothetical protein